MRYAKLIKNDIVNIDKGIAVSYWSQGCVHRCKGCHNPGTWSYEGGIEIEREALIGEILAAISASGIKRNFSVLGGEPLDTTNREDTLYIIKKVREIYPEIRIFLWTGYELNEIDKTTLKNIDVIITGRYIEELRDITLPLRGSKNQQIIEL